MGLNMQAGGLGGMGGPPQDAEQPLPRFRRDLELYRSPDEPDGSPAYSIYDPVRSQFFKMGLRMGASRADVDRFGAWPDCLAFFVVVLFGTA